MRSSTVVTEIKYHRIKTMANTCMKQSCIRSIYAYTLYVRYVSTFYAVVFFLLIYVVVLNKRIYVSVIYVFVYWCVLWCVHGLLYWRATDVTLNINNRTSVCFYHLRHCGAILMIEYMFIRPHHTMKFIYLRCTVAFTYGVYKYTTVDINTPYKRFKSILWWFLLFIYMILSTDFYICIYLYVYVHGISYMYIYICISPIFYMYIRLYIDTYVCFLGITYWPHVCSHDCQQNAATSEHLFCLIHSKFSIRLETLVG